MIRECTHAHPYSHIHERTPHVYLRTHACTHTKTHKHKSFTHTYVRTRTRCMNALTDLHTHTHNQFSPNTLVLFGENNPPPPTASITPFHMSLRTWICYKPGCWHRRLTVGLNKERGEGEMAHCTKLFPLWQHPTSQHPRYSKGRNSWFIPAKANGNSRTNVLFPKL